MTFPPRAHLGASLALTGPEAPYGRQLLAVLEMAVADAGDHLRLQVEDDEGDPAAARRAAHRLAEGPAIAVIGPMNSWTCEEQGPIFADAGLLQITPSASNPQLSRRGWATFFRACPSDDRQADVLARVAAVLARARRVAAVHDHTSFAEPLAMRFAEYATGRGLRVTGIAGVSPHQPHGASLAAIVASTPDAVLVAGLEAECAAAATALRTAGCRAILLGTDAVKPTHTLRLPGFPPPLLTNSAADAKRLAPAFDARVSARCGVHDSVYTVEAYDVARHLVAWASRHPTASRRDVFDALRTPFTGLAGSYAFDTTGERTDAGLGVYRDEEDGLRFLGMDRDLLPS